MKPIPPEEDDAPEVEEPVKRLKHPVYTTDKEAASLANGWAIATNFAFGVMGMGLIGWAIQTWLWKSAAPWPLLVCLLVGLVGGMLKFIRDALAANK